MSNLHQRTEQSYDNQPDSSFDSAQESLSAQEIPLLDYASMALEELYTEAKNLLEHENVQRIKKHADAIAVAFEQKLAAFLEEKKSEFLNNGGTEQDFKIALPLKQEFEKWQKDFKSKLSQFYKNNEQMLQANLARKQDLISEIKNLVSLSQANEEKEWDMAALRKKFFELRDEFKKIGQVPKESYEEVWKSFHHHVERFYDLMNINRELQEMDFKNNLEQKQSIIAQAKELLALPDAHKASRELQKLHRIWKEETGPVSKEYRERIWEEFRSITEQIYQKRNDQNLATASLEQANLQAKQEVIAKIKALSQQGFTQHNQWQKAIKELETIREEFFQIGKIPQAQVEPLWKEFKQAIADFNKKKNSFYKNLKHTQSDSLQQKKALLELALSYKDSEAWEETAQMLKQIQKQWSQTDALLNSKQSNELWSEFRSACNAFFDRYTLHRKSLRKQEEKVFKEKKVVFDQLKAFELTGNHNADMQALQAFRSQWEAFSKTSLGDLEIRFNKMMNALYHKLKAHKEQVQEQKYAKSVQQMNPAEKAREQLFARKKIDELKAALLQAENNLQFFVNVDEKNPIYKSAIRAMEQKREAISLWENRLRELRESKEESKEENNQGK